MLNRLLQHPLTRGLDMDAPETTALRQRLFREKPFLRRLYGEFHARMAAALPAEGGRVLELGAGGGPEPAFPDLIRSELFPVPGIAAVLDGRVLPFRAGSLRGIVMTNVLHHIPEPRRFFAEAARCVRPGGAVVMLEPWLSTWSRFVYGRLHYEPCTPGMEEWRVTGDGPLTGSDEALPWVIFERDRARFEEEFPVWRVDAVTPACPFRYLLSGGVSMRSLMPGWTFGLWRGVERCLEPWMGFWAMFAYIVLRRTDSGA
ncbi:MAG: class I SAM-dependent methyltransferase [Candidatus Hydrogenedentes bacterium]|nr:class I SAM-dependent methyltransferase [Candidatus Hydrogenedentota bacterium]